MAGPVYDSNGGGNNATGSAGLLAVTLTYPATISANDLLVCHISGRAGTSVDTLDLPIGWTDLASIGVGTSHAARSFYKIAVGTEDGTTQAITGSYTGTVPRIVGIIERYTGNLASSTIEAIGTNSGNSTAAAPANVVTTGANELAVCHISMIGNQTPGSITGETGGDYTETYAEFNGGSSVTIDTQTAAIASAGTLSGGSCTITSNPWTTITFAILSTVASASGSLSSTLAATTLSAQGSESAKGSLAVTLAAVTISANGSETSSGSLSQTLAAVTVSAAGSESAKGSLASTLAATTLVANGSESQSGSLTQTLAATTLTANGSETASGSLTQTLAATTFSGAGSANASGSLTQALASVTVSAAGSDAASGSLTSTLDATTLAGSGSESGQTGSLSQTLAAITLAGNGSETASGSLTQTLANTTFVGAGTTGFSGAVSQTLADTTLTAAGSESQSGSLSQTTGAVTLAASGSESQDGALSQTLQDTTFVGGGSLGQTSSGALSSTLADTTLSASGSETAQGSLTSTLDNCTVVAGGTAVGTPSTGGLSVSLDNVTLFPNTFVTVSAGGGVVFGRKSTDHRKKRDEQDLAAIISILDTLDEDETDAA